VIVLEMITTLSELKRERDNLRLGQKIDGIALASLNEKLAKAESRIEKLRSALEKVVDERKRDHQVWALEPGVQVKFERREGGGNVKITRILKAENGHEYEDSENS